MKKLDKAITKNSIMTVDERKEYLNKIPWVSKRKEELKSLDKGNMFLKMKELNSEVSLYPSSEDNSKYTVLVHTVEDKVRKYMNGNKYIVDDFNQNYIISNYTFSEAVSLFIKLSREIKSLEESNSSDKMPDNKEQKDRYSTKGIKLTIKEIKERIDKISDISGDKSVLHLYVNRDGYVVANSYNIRYGCPIIRLIPRDNGKYYLDIIIDRNLNYQIKYDLEEYVRESLGFNYNSGIYRLISDESFNITFNKFRDIAKDVIVFILNHEVFKNSTKKYGSKNKR